MRNLSIAMLALCGCAAMRNQGLTESSLLEADRAFAVAATERGVEGFKSFLTADVVGLSGTQPVLGRDPMAEGWRSILTNQERAISWAPTAGGIIESAAIGLTTGRYLIRNRADGAVLSSGRYTTIWRRSANGWKVVLDGGAPDCKECAAK